MMYRYADAQISDKKNKVILNKHTVRSFVAVSYLYSFRKFVLIRYS